MPATWASRAPIELLSASCKWSSSAVASPATVRSVVRRAYSSMTTRRPTCGVKPGRSPTTNGLGAVTRPPARGRPWPAAERRRWLGSRSTRGGSGRPLPPGLRARLLVHLPDLLLPGRLRAAGADLHPAAALPLLRQRDGDFQDAVLEARLDLLLVYALRERDAARERAVAPLGAVEALLPLIGFLPALAGDGEHAILDLDLHVVRGEPGQVRADHQLVPALEHLHRRRPLREPAATQGHALLQALLAARQPAPRLAPAAWLAERRRELAPAVGREEAVHLLAHRLREGERVRHERAGHEPGIGHERREQRRLPLPSAGERAPRALLPGAALHPGAGRRGALPAHLPRALLVGTLLGALCPTLRAALRGALRAALRDGALRLSSCPLLRHDR